MATAYTVILMKPAYTCENADDLHERSTLQWVVGETVEEAFGMAQDQACKDRDFHDTKPSDFVVIAVFERHLTDLFIA